MANKPSYNPAVSDPLVRSLLLLLNIIAGIVLAAFLWQGIAYFQDVIVVFFFAWLVSFLLGPAVEALRQRARMPRWAAVAVTYLGATALLALIGVLLFPILINQIGALAAQLPAYVAPIPGLLTGIEQALLSQGIAVQLSDLYNAGEVLRQAQTVGAGLAANALGLAQGLAGFLVNIALILILSVYMLLDGQRLTATMVRLLPLSWEADAAFFLSSVDRIFGGFVRSLFVQGAVYGFGTAAVMLIAGLDFVLPVALLAGALMVIPFLGPLISVIPPLIIAAFTGDIVRILLVVGGLLVLQQIVVNVVGPKVVGDAIGLHPMFVLLALIVGIRLAGFWGAIFAIPIVGIVYAMGYSIYERQRQIPAETPL